MHSRTPDTFLCILVKRKETNSTIGLLSLIAIEEIPNISVLSLIAIKEIPPILYNHTAGNGGQCQNYLVMQHHTVENSRQIICCRAATEDSPQIICCHAATEDSPRIFCCRVVTEDSTPTPFRHDAIKANT